MAPPRTQMRMPEEMFSLPKQPLASSLHNHRESATVQEEETG